MIKNDHFLFNIPKVNGKEDCGAIHRGKLNHMTSLKHFNRKQNSFLMITYWSSMDSIICPFMTKIFEHIVDELGGQ